MPLAAAAADMESRYREAATAFPALDVSASSGIDDWRELAAAFAALEPMFLMTSLIGYSEELVGILFVLTAWAAVKGLRHLPYLALAGLFAALGFLAKASIGWVFVVAIVLGFLWIRRVRGWWILRDKWFLAGAGIFVLLAGGAGLLASYAISLGKERGLRVAAGVLLGGTTGAFAGGGLVGWLLRAGGGWA